ncbi:Phenylacetate-coenzyme A ligase [Rosistilla carotiformis]|uniref:Phenylacetate-coenzyme A ligase n=1 Tax=Rosistilla carotiformis TaxID=2528017 RepID=A0A518K0R0_9BACT|nr:AMP-binding protein [Rosistilla carotiformis]QDV71345.1 Phenylacetate-coenzyme A ligase [Rosistilla carotiformis]
MPQLGYITSLFNANFTCIVAIMLTYDAHDRFSFTQLPRDLLEAVQLERFNRLVETILPHNAFHAERLVDIPFPLRSLGELRQLPTLTKADLIAAGDTFPPRFHTFDASRYIRLHRTSGTTGRPLPLLDTADDWQWWIDTWQFVLDAADVTSDDRAFMAFSFGPFIGFWSANDALAARGAMVIPGGGLSTAARLTLLQDSDATILCCTPTYALHMADVAKAEEIPIESSSIRCVIVAGEPGGSIPEVRQRIEAAWGAKVIDHSGATEIGPWGVGTTDGTSLQVIESEFIAEFLLKDGTPADEGQLSELVLTNLGRIGAPMIRYRTGDLVRPHWEHQDTCRFIRLQGGVLGRADDMVVVRGVNVFPSSIERVIRSFPELGEFRILLSKQGQMDQVRVEVEDPQNDPQRIGKQFEATIGLRIDVKIVPPDSLPRFEAKARRVIDNRKSLQS